MVSINDSVHGLIQIPRRLFHIIDTPEYQRLRDIKQLGGSSYVFIGATHTRFEHGLGTCHVASDWYIHLTKNTPHYDENMHFCVQVAALCHDIGHGPFSHLFETYFVKPLEEPMKSQWNHENLSCVILEEIVKNNPLVKLDLTSLNIIKAMIKGDKLDTYPPFLFQLVHNKQFEIDADKIDYIQRDCKHAGMTVNVDLKRLVLVSKLSEKLEIEYPMKESFNISELFSSRYSLYKKVYFHPVSGAIELMLKDIMKQNSTYLQLNNLKKGVTPETLQWYLSLTDSIINELERKSISPLIARLRCRDIYKLTNYFFLKSSVTEKQIEHMLDTFKHELERKGLDGDIIFITRNWCKGKNNPINEINFNPPIQNYQNVDSLMPMYFQEQVISVYAKKKIDIEVISEAISTCVTKDETISSSIGAYGQTKTTKKF